MKFCCHNWHWQCHYTACCKITQYMWGSNTQEGKTNYNV